MATGPRALVRAGDGTVGTPVAMAGGITLVTPSQAGERAQLGCEWQVGGISGHVFNLERPP